ncbi:MAG: AbrB/MazE/SpoVT family DNA-binding domain-containing protein [Balneolaceae bacterium]|nr:AbrB/MazE/SpoVT family DNA-binding domain-containing protein [Balneolaceae bacterium]
MKTTMTQKGQIVIPAELRRKYDLKAGTTIHVEEENGKIVLKPVTAAYIRSLRGILKTPEGEKSALDMLKEEREADRRREDEGFSS